MFQLSQKALDRFKAIYLEHEGIALSDEQANTKGLEILEMMKVVYRDIPKTNEYEYLDEKLPSA